MSIANLIIRPFDRADLPALIALEQSSIADDPRLEDSFHCWLDSFHELILVAILDGEIVGYAGYHLPGPPFSLSLTINRVVVNKNVRRRGIGQALLNELLAISAKHFDCTYTNAVPRNDPVCHQFLLKNEFVDAGAQAYQWKRFNMSRRKRNWRVVPDGQGGYKPIEA